MNLWTDPIAWTVVISVLAVVLLVASWRRLAPFLLQHAAATLAAVYALAVIVTAAMMPAFSLRDYVAAYELPVNHRIAERDLKRPPGPASSYGFYLVSQDEIVGKYVLAKIGADKAIKRSSLAEGLTMVAADPANRVFAFPLPAGSKLIDMLQVGSPVLLLGQTEDKKPCAIEATVHGISCAPSKGADGCYPVLSLAHDHARIVVRNQAGFQLVLRDKTIVGGMCNEPTHLAEDRF